MKKKMPGIWLGLMAALVLLATGCSEKPADEAAPSTTAERSPARYRAPLAKAPLPADLSWRTNTQDPVYASPEAEKGGTLRLFLLSFPMTFRVVGPDSNSSFRSAILGNQLSLIRIHPNTQNVIPGLATHWAYGADRKTMYFKLDPAARWSDGKPVTAHDFAYTLEFMRSPHIIAPWYNDYYRQEIERVRVYDEHTLAVVSTKAQPDLHLKLALRPIPSHFYGTLGPDFVQKFNWRLAPNTGAYKIADFEKGKYITFARKQNWWARDRRYMKHRFNVDQVRYTVVKDYNMAWEYFKKGRLDVFSVTMPDFWHNKTRTGVVENGYAHKIWFYNNTQQSAQGLWLNQDKPIFQDRRVRYAFAHAMNVQKVIENVLRGDYLRLEHGFMGYGKYSHQGIKARRFDLDKVAEYMQKAGWQRGPDGLWQKNQRRFSVDVTYGFEGHTPRLVVLKEEAKKAGIQLNLRKLDPSSAFKQILEKKHDVAWMGWSTSLRPQYWEHFHSANAHKPQTNNITNTDDPQMDKLIEAYRRSLEAPERQKLSRQIQARIHEIGCFVPTFRVPFVRQVYWRWWQLPDPPGTRHTTDLFDPFDSSTGGLFWQNERLREKTRAAREKGQTFEPVSRVDKTFLPSR